MTNEEAIKAIKSHCYFANLVPVGKEALDMAIKALEQEPCEDTISRADAVRVASGYCHPANIAKELAKLPPVTPKPKVGHWIEEFNDLEGEAKFDEAIKRYFDNAEYERTHGNLQGCLEFRQLAKLLKELKAYRKICHKEHVDDCLRAESGDKE